MSPAPPAIPSLPAATSQVIRVYGEPGGSHATLATFGRDNGLVPGQPDAAGDWRAVFAPMPAQIGELGFSEALWRFHPAYRHFAVIGFNLPAVPGRGSAIFLHEGTGGPTAGCVSLGHDDLVAVLTWLDPAASPRIVLGPDG